MKTEAGNVQENRYDSEGRRYELLGNGRRISFVYHNGEFLHEKGEELMKVYDIKFYGKATYDLEQEVWKRTTPIEVPFNGKICK